MADFADLGSAREALDTELARKVRKPVGPAATGLCLSCDAPLPDGRRWCDADCRDDWQAEQARGF